MNKKKTNTEKPAAAKPEEKKPEETKPQKSAKKVTVIVGGVERSGPVVSKRKANGENEVCVKLDGFGARWFKVADIIE